MQARTSRRIASLVAGIAALVLAASTGTAGAQAGDPVVYDATPPLQLTAPGTQVGITFTISPVPPCADGNLATLDGLDFTLSDPSGASTLTAFTTSEPPGSASGTFSPDMRELSILFDAAILCENPPGPPPPTTKSVTVTVTVDVPAQVPLGTVLSLEGVARGFTVPPNQEYTLARTGFVLVGELPPPPPPPPSPPPEPDNGSDGAGVGVGVGTGPGSVAVVPQQAPAATAVGATARFTG